MMTITRCTPPASPRVFSIQAQASVVVGMKKNPRIGHKALSKARPM